MKLGSTTSRSFARLPCATTASRMLLPILKELVRIQVDHRVGKGFDYVGNLVLVYGWILSSFCRVLLYQIDDCHDRQ